MISNEPRMERREAQPYAAIHFRTSGESEFRNAADNGFPELFGWLAERGIEPAGPAMIRTHAVGADGFPIEFELAVDIAAPIEGDGRVVGGELPAGEYATLIHVGPFVHDEVPDLRQARERLFAWAADHGIADPQQVYTERYLTGPDEPDWTKWRTELVLR